MMEIKVAFEKNLLFCFLYQGGREFGGTQVRFQLKFHRFSSGDNST